MPSIRIPSALRKFTGGASDVDVTATTVRAAIAALDGAHPGVGAKILDGGAIKPFIRIFVGAEQAELDTSVAAKDEISIIPAIAGGHA
ncbi:MAG TPA: MoaD/ThiS family protein [Kofleriaceae bacterium]|jgi:molybdopterin converting factor small subunit